MHFPRTPAPREHPGAGASPEAGLWPLVHHFPLATFYPFALDSSQASSLPDMAPQFLVTSHNWLLTLQSSACTSPPHSIVCTAPSTSCATKYTIHTLSTSMPTLSSMRPGPLSTALPPALCPSSSPEGPQSLRPPPAWAGRPDALLLTNKRPGNHPPAHAAPTLGIPTGQRLPEGEGPSAAEDTAMHQPLTGERRWLCFGFGASKEGNWLLLGCPTLPASFLMLSKLCYRILNTCMAWNTQWHQSSCQALASAGKESAIATLGPRGQTPLSGDNSPQTPKCLVEPERAKTTLLLQEGKKQTASGSPVPDSTYHWQLWGQGQI